MECSNCVGCGDIDDDEIYTDSETGLPLCRDCYTDTHFECCRCGDDEHESYQHEMVVVFDHQAAGLAQNGIFKITRKPYYSAPLIGNGEIFSDAVRFIAPVSKLYIDPGYPCGHLCRDCQSKAMKGK